MFKVIKTPEQVQAEELVKTNEARITELERLLSESDYRVLPDYDKPDADIKIQRQVWREEIRQLKVAIS
jgi:glucuronate isomerase